MYPRFVNKDGEIVSSYGTKRFAELLYIYIYAKTKNSIFCTMFLKKDLPLDYPLLWDVRI